MARLGVRSGALMFACSTEDAEIKRFERTGANGCEHRWLLPCRRSWVRVPSSSLSPSCPRSPPRALLTSGFVVGGDARPAPLHRSAAHTRLYPSRQARVEEQEAQIGDRARGEEHH